MSLKAAIQSSPVHVISEKGIVIINRENSPAGTSTIMEEVEQGKVVALDGVTREIIGQYCNIASAAASHNINHLLVLECCELSTGTVDVPITFDTSSTPDVYATIPIAFKYKNQEEKFLAKYQGPFTINQMIFARENERSQSQHMAKVMELPEFACDFQGNDNAITIAWESQNFKRKFPINPSLCQAIDTSDEVPRKRAKKVGQTLENS